MAPSLIFSIHHAVSPTSRAVRHRGSLGSSLNGGDTQQCWMNSTATYTSHGIQRARGYFPATQF